MKEYETVFIAHPTLSDAQAATLNERVKSLIEKGGGRFFYSRLMGKRKLAYRISKQTKGIYYCVDYASGGEVVNELERMFRLSEDVIRFLTVKKNDDVDVEARAAEIAARGEDKAPVVAEEQPARLDEPRDEDVEEASDDFEDK